ncbi:MAG: hypothetical protein AAF618_06500 [Pseudomonadota bacterium]
MQVKIFDAAFDVAALSDAEIMKRAKTDLASLGTGFRDLTVWDCAKKGRGFFLPPKVVLEPLLLFEKPGKPTSPIAARTRKQNAIILRYTRSKTVQALVKHINRDVGVARHPVPSEQIRAALDKDARQVVGYRLNYAFFKFEYPFARPPKPSFILGLPILIHWELFVVGRCGTLITEEAIKGAEGMKVVPVDPPRFVPGPYQKLAKAEHKEIEVTDLSVRIGTGTSEGVTGPNPTWEKMRALRGKRRIKVDKVSQNEQAHIIAQDGGGLPLSSGGPTTASDGARMLAKYG